MERATMIAVVRQVFDRSAEKLKGYEVGRQLSSSKGGDMGRVPTLSEEGFSPSHERYYSRVKLDFDTNKKMLEEIAGFYSHLMKQIQKGPVCIISLKLEEEERECRMDFVPTESTIKTDSIAVDPKTIEMLAAFGMADLPGIVIAEPEEAAPAAAFSHGAGALGSRYWF
ncbi:hypothetical protein Nepgr_001331 [Nepenthes gracilis]|uniref:Uncharacterized protein n=1 Tax=Nepenthes gracilis TaxID=150966 RepID=A0AAD3RW05_NEPGR|nr:hypothetical protein Nepgr_001331 [Nepenthes gracilis]